MRTNLPTLPLVKLVFKASAAIYQKCICISMNIWIEDLNQSVLKGRGMTKEASAKRKFLGFWSLYILSFLLQIKEGSQLPGHLQPAIEQLNSKSHHHLASLCYAVSISSNVLKNWSTLHFRLEKNFLGTLLNSYKSNASRQ